MSEITTEFTPDLSGHGAPIGATLIDTKYVVSVFVDPSEGVLRFSRTAADDRYPNTWTLPIAMSSALLEALIRMHGGFRWE